MTLRRKTPLQRRTPLASKSRDSMKAHEQLPGRKVPTSGGLRRSGRLRPMSEKRRAELSDEAAVRAAVFERDGHRCRIKPLLRGTRWERCWGRLTAHHLKKDGQGGGYTMENLITACAGHNDWVEDQPRLARELGLVR